MKVLLEENAWLLGWPEACYGNPPITANEEDAYEFDNMQHTKKALKEARVYKPYENAQIVDDFI